MQRQNVLRYSWWYLVIKSMVHEPYVPARLHHVTKHMYMYMAVLHACRWQPTKQ